MRNDIQPFIYIDEPSVLQKFHDDNHDVPWLCFDTEFIGEKRYRTLLCLIQIATPNGNYFVDSLSLKDLSPLLKLIQSPSILKITHAGENDYRILYNLFGITPKNVFDTQISAGFIGYPYPISFGKLVNYELGIRLSKGYTVANWEARPIAEKQLIYALDDVVHLYPLHQSLKRKVKDCGRLDWVKEESKKLERPRFYESDPHKEALNHNMMAHLNFQKQLFLLRIFDWRRKEAIRKDYSKEMVLPAKQISSIVKHIDGGKPELKSNRRIPDHLLTRYWDMFNNFFLDKPTTEEIDILKRIPILEKEDHQRALISDLLYLMIKHRCNENGIAPSLVINKKQIMELSKNPEVYKQRFADSWKEQCLGTELMHKLTSPYQSMNIEIQNGQCIFTFR